MKMKNIFKICAMTLLAFGISSCSKDEPGGTATQAMAGEWKVLVDAVDAQGNVIIEDPFDMGYFDLLTYNTSANVPTEMFIDDLGNFWEFKVVVNVNLDTKTFNASHTVDLYNDIYVDVLNGSIEYGTGVSQQGYTADTISFMVAFEDDDYIGDVYDYLWIHGYRKTGLYFGED